MKFKIRRNHAQENYVRLMNTAVKLFKCKIEDILDDNYKSKPQDDKLTGKYYDRNSVDYKSLKNFLLNLKI